MTSCENTDLEIKISRCSIEILNHNNLGFNKITIADSSAYTDISSKEKMKFLHEINLCEIDTNFYIRTKYPQDNKFKSHSWGLIIYDNKTKDIFSTYIFELFQSIELIKHDTILKLKPVEI